MQRIKASQWYGSAFFLGNICFWYGLSIPWWQLLALCLIISISTVFKTQKIALVVLLGFGYPLVAQLLESNPFITSPELPQRQLIEGRVITWVSHKTDSSHFIFEIDKLNFHAIRPVKVQLSCFPTCDNINLGATWRLLVKLKQTHGLANPAGFDYERWQFSRAIKAQGYVINSTYNRQINTMSGLDKVRLIIKKRLLSSFYDNQVSGSILAMLLGDRSVLSSETKLRLSETGTGHLIAISGLHVGLAAMMGFALGIVLWRLLTYRRQALAMIPVAWVCASIFALFYAAMSGFGLPAQRALTMIGAFALSHMLNKHWSLGQRFSLALILVLVLQPQAPLAIAFWLSFVVTGILVIYQGLVIRQGYWRSLLLLQAVLFISLLGLQSFIFNQIALSALVYNMFAIPWVSIVVLPISMLWLILDSIAALFQSGLSTAHVLTWLVHLSYEFFWFVLSTSDLPEYSYVSVNLAGVSAVLLPLALIVIVLNQSLRLRSYFLFTILLLFYPEPEDEELVMTVLDVGQGLAVVFKIAGEVVIYDTGYGDSESSLAAAIILPFLQRNNIESLRLMVISHDDNDHSGGQVFLTQNISVDELITPSNQANANTSCYAGKTWLLGLARLTILSPHPNDHFESDNNNSCVMLLEIHERRILFTGDIEYEAEQTLLSRYANLSADIIFVPHHGSKTSSTRGFIEQIRPKIAINSSGYLNRFGLPAEITRQRYQQINADFYDTQTHGAIEITIDVDSNIEISGYREQNPALWRRNCYISQNYFVIQDKRNLSGC